MFLTSSICCVSGHFDKPNVVKYHPTASGVLASSALDLTVKIWDVNKAKALITLNGHTEQVGNICARFAVDHPVLSLIILDTHVLSDILSSYLVSFNFC